jgi:hypothetical protein
MSSTCHCVVVAYDGILDGVREGEEHDEIKGVELSQLPA